MKKVIAISKNRKVAVLDDNPTFMIVSNLKFKDNQLIDYQVFECLAHSLAEALVKMEKIAEEFY